MSTVKSKKVQLGTDANSANNFTIYQPATPDGTLRIGVGNADSPTEVGQFNANGYKPATAPAFFSYPSSAVSVSSATPTKIPFNLTDFNTGDYDTTNYRFTPSVAGYYQVNAHAYFGTSIADQQQVWIGLYKNGSGYMYGSVQNASGNDNLSPSISTLIYLNGSTDYIEIYVRHGQAGATKDAGSFGRAFNGFSAFLARAA
jgi:hypothetical protein